MQRTWQAPERQPLAAARRGSQIGGSQIVNDIPHSVQVHSTDYGPTALLTLLRGSCPSKAEPFWPTDYMAVRRNKEAYNIIMT